MIHKIYVTNFRKPWLRVKLVNFDFSAKPSSTDYNESNKPNPKSLVYEVWKIACWIRSSKKWAFNKIKVKVLIHKKLRKTSKNRSTEVNACNDMQFSNSRSILLAESDIKLYAQTLGNSMSDHIRKIIILLRSCVDHLTFVLNEKSLSHFMPIGLSHLTRKAKKKKKEIGTWKRT